jgi:preprotein translocase subunit SecA
LDAAFNRWSTRVKRSRLGVRYLHRESRAVLALESEWSGLSDAALDERLMGLREVFARRQHTAEHMRAALAGIREVSHRHNGEKPYGVQVMGVLGLFHRQIIEMATGEGKTLTAAVAAVLLGWLRRPVHVITVNDYLAQRDADLGQPLFKRCGLSAAAVVGETPEPERLRCYQQPIVYTTQKELVADWLRDQLRLGRLADPVSTRWLLDAVPRGPQRVAGLAQAPVMVPGLYVAIVDEADAVLIDEAVTPLIIARPREEDAQAELYERARDLAAELAPGKDFAVDLAKRRVKLTGAGRAKIVALLRPDEHAIWRAVHRREELVEQALVAQHCYHHRQHYQIVEDRVVIVDEYTGRFMADRQWQHGLHQAIEAKHRLPVTADRDTLASMSFQRFFKQYEHLCGMTGTAADATVEMETTYSLPVRVIPTHRPVIRQRWPDMMFVTAELKWRAIASEVERLHMMGRPMLIGTRSIEASELLSSLLTERKLEHQVLNAVHQKAEAQIIAQAGQPGAITVATNMAGRGTDIKLGRGVADLGGLHVILTERHSARRVDRQLVGRSGRQGDPGSAQAILSLEDDLVVKYAPGASAALRQTFAGRSAPLPRWVRLVFDMAQRRAQNQARLSRAAVMRQDEELDRSLPR